MSFFQSRDMTQGPLPRQIVIFSIPLIFTNLLQVLFNMADISVVGRFSGTAALGAVGSTSMLITMFTGFLMGIGGGVNVLTARYLGEKRPDSVRETTHTALILCALIGLFFLVFGQFFSRTILEWMGTKSEYLEGAALYLRIYFLGMPALALYNWGNAVLSASGDTRRPLIYLSCAGILNVVLNLFFVIVCGMAVEGVALASILSQYLSAALIVIALLREQSAVRLAPGKIRIHGDKAKTLLALGLPSGAQNSIFALANTFIQAGVNTFDAVMVAGNSAAMNADSIVYDAMAAFYTAASTFMSQNYGARKKERIRKSYLLCMALAFGIAVLLSGCLLLAGRSFLSVFTSDPQVVEAGMQRLTIMCCSYAFSALMDCTIAGSRGLGKSFVPMVIVLLGSCVFRIAWIYTVFAHFHTVFSLYSLYFFSWALTGTAELVYFLKVYRAAVGTMPDEKGGSV